MGLIDMLRNWQEKQNAGSEKVSEFRKSRNPDTQDEVLISKRMEYKKWQEMEEKEHLKKALDEKRKEFTSKNMFGDKENSIVQDYEYRQAQTQPEKTTTPSESKKNNSKKGYAKYANKIAQIAKGDSVWKISKFSHNQNLKMMRVAPRTQQPVQKVSILGVPSSFIKKREEFKKTNVNVLGSGGVKVL